LQLAALNAAKDANDLKTLLDYVDYHYCYGPMKYEPFALSSSKSLP